MANLTTEIAGVKLKSPILLASGIAGFGEEYCQLIDLNIFGAFVTKTITLKPRAGNLPPRIVETLAGIVNSIGLENPGLELFLKEKLPFLQKRIKIPIIASIAGENSDEFVEICRRLSKANGISALELNLSCPNIRKRTINSDFKIRPESQTVESRLISQNPDLTYEVVKKVKKLTGLPVIAKLSPNVTDITVIAQSAESAGADALSLVNTFSALAFPHSPNHSITPAFAEASSFTKVSEDRSAGRQSPVFGGLSGPAIKPVALRMIYETSQKVKIPIIGIGGINSPQDALEFFLVGAKTIALGSALFRDPSLPEKILAGLAQYLKTKKISLKELVGSLTLRE